MKKGTLIIIFAIHCMVIGFIFTDANAEYIEHNKLDEIIKEAQIAGAYGMMSQIISFQVKTKMKGGDEFIIKFINTKAESLGLTSEEFVKNLKNIDDEFKIYMKILEMK